MLSTPTILVLTAFAISFILLCAMYTSRREVNIAHNTLDGIADCLGPKGVPIGQLLDERARANTRLVKAFNLTNTFVSRDENIHSRFVKQAQGLLYQANRNGWRRFSDLSSQAVQAELIVLADGETVAYDRFVQAVCLRAILVGLLGVDASVESFLSTDINIVTTNINLLWSLSKTSETAPLHLLPQLTDSLRRLVPDNDKYPNPIDFVIPAWETLWRVVAIAVAQSCQNDEMVDALTNMNARPSSKTFETVIGGVSVKGIIAETMRLHPPSKRIGRVTFRSTPTLSPSRVVQLLEKILPASVLRGIKKESADVRAVQVSEAIWGEDATAFNPSRFVRKEGLGWGTEEARTAHQFLFGGGTLRCIGAQWAPVAAGILASAIMAQVNGHEEASLTRGKVIGGRDGWDDWYIEGIQFANV